MRDVEMEQRMLRYEGLVISTTRRWRGYISQELADEDVQQELRMKVFRALQTFNPNHPSGYPEERHVFGAVRNKVKDLIVKKRLNATPLSELGGKMRDKERRADSPEGILEFRFGKLDATTTEALRGLPKDQQEIAVSLGMGYNHSETMTLMKMKHSVYQRHLAELKIHLRNYANGNPR